MRLRKSPELKSSLANKLILIFLFASLYPFSLVTFMGYFAMRDMITSSTQEGLRTLAQAKESALVAHLTGRRADLVEAAASMRPHRASPDILSGLLDAWRPRLKAESLSVIGRDGNVLAGAPSRVATLPTASVEVVGPARLWRASAFLDDQTLVVARWPLAEVTRLLQHAGSRRGRVTTSLVEPGGLIVAGSISPDPDRRVPPEILTRLREGTLGKDTAYQNTLGQIVFGVAAGVEISRLLGAPWTLVVEEGVDSALWPVQQLHQRLMFFGLVMFILFIVIAVLFARTIMNPIEQLIMGTRLIGSGRLEHRLTIKTGDEIEQLAREFNSMTAELQESYTSLEEKIARATAELREHMEQLAEERDKIDGILRSVAEALILTDRDRRLVLANPAAEALFAFSLDEAVGRQVATVVGPEPVRDVLTRLLESRETGASEEVEFTPPPADGPRAFRVQMALVIDRMGETLGVVTVFQDVTPFRELDRMKSEFLSTASHELRTPLTSIQGFSEILLSRELGREEATKFLRYINDQSQHLANLIGDLLDVARIEAGKGFELELSPLDLGSAVASSVEVFRSRNTPHTFTVEVAEGLPQVVADQHKIEQVLQNLLSNSVKYSPEGGTIRVSLAPRQGAVLLEVADEGVGMSREQVARIFEKFYRGDHSHGAVEGTGLGMSIVKHIVEAHGGAVWVESELGRGTTVFFTLPCPGASGPDAPEPPRGEPARGRVV